MFLSQGSPIFQVFPGFFQDCQKVYMPPRGAQAFLRVTRFFPEALKAESSRER